MIQVSNWSEKKCSKKSWLQGLICSYFCVHSCKKRAIYGHFCKTHLLKKTSTFANPTEQRFALSTGCSLKYMRGVCKNITHEHKIHLHTPKLGFWSIKHHEILPTISPSMCPHFCGHVHKSVDITQTQTSSAKLQWFIHVKILALAAFYCMLFSIMEQKIQMDDTYTYTFIFEHISSCIIAHMSTTRQSTNMCRRYICMTAVNVHQSNLRKTGVLKLLQDKNQLLINTQT